MAERVSRGQNHRVGVLKTIYPIFKREVYVRRQSVMWIATGGNAVLLALLLAVTSQWLIIGEMRWVVVVGVLVFSGLLIAQMHQQNLRHKQAKHSLIDIEKALGFFDEGYYLAGKSLYPQTWQRLPDRDWQYFISVLSLVAMTALVTLSYLMA